jgi:type IV secretory pathway VirB4 component
VIDPEDEYTPLAEHVGGTVIQLGAPGVRLNPLDLPADTGVTAFRDHQLSLHTIIKVMLGTVPPPSERQALDRAITATYAAAGITHDPASWGRPAPLLRDLAATLTADNDPAAQLMAAQLAPWTSGSYKDLFDGPTSTRPTGHLVVWSLRHLPDELRTIGTLLTLNHIWGRIDQTASSNHRVKRLVVVDEAWLLMRDGEGARFLSRMAKAARKRNAGLVVVTQDAADVLGSDLGLAVVSNAATQVLMRQSTQAIDAVTEAFGLTGGEARLLLSAGRGEGLLVAGRSRVPFRSQASGSEHSLAVTGIGGEQ